MMKHLGTKEILRKYSIITGEKKRYEYHYKFLSVPICCPFYMIREESGSALGGENLLE